MDQRNTSNTKEFNKPTKDVDKKRMTADGKFEYYDEEEDEWVPSHELAKRQKRRELEKLKAKPFVGLPDLENLTLGQCKEKCKEDCECEDCCSTEDEQDQLEHKRYVENLKKTMKG